MAVLLFPEPSQDRIAVRDYLTWASSFGALSTRVCKRSNDAAKRGERLVDLTSFLEALSGSLSRLRAL
jgi:hypothetical protein